MKGYRDSFEDLSRYYDPLMEHVDYERWFVVTTSLAQLMPRDFRHLDAACGTGVLLRRLQKTGWRSLGFDLSHSMLRMALRNDADLRLAQADLRHLPFCHTLDYITCLFDSVNFLLENADLYRAFHEVHQALRSNGILYFDIITERMVLEHFADQSWVENNGTFSSTWETSYNRTTKIAETTIRVGTHPASVLYERVYDLQTVLDALQSAGFDILGVFDAETWRKPARKTLRMDIVATPNGTTQQQNALDKLAVTMRRVLR